MATCSAGLLIRSWSKEPRSYNCVAPKKLPLRKTAQGSAYCDHGASSRMYMNDPLCLIPCSICKAFYRESRCYRMHNQGYFLYKLLNQGFIWNDPALQWGPKIAYIGSPKKVDYTMASQTSLSSNRFDYVQSPRNVHGSISTQSHGSISQAHFWRVEHLLVSTPSRYQLQWKRKNSNRQQKNPKKKKSTSGMKAVSNYVLALRNMHQDKTANSKPSQNKPTWKTTATKWMGTSRITTESIAAESILCPNLCWQQQLINERVSRQIQQEPAQGRKVLVEKRQQDENCIKFCTCSKKNAARQSSCKPSQNISTWRELLQTGWVQVESLQKALQQNPLRVQIWQQRLINEHVSKQIQQEPAQGRKVLVEAAKWKLYQTMYLL